MTKTVKVLVTIAAAATALAAALCLIGVFWDQLLSLCPSCAKDKLPCKADLKARMARNRDIADEFADYEEF